MLQQVQRAGAGSAGVESLELGQLGIHRRHDRVTRLSVCVTGVRLGVATIGHSVARARALAPRVRCDVTVDCGLRARALGVGPAGPRLTRLGELFGVG